MVLFWGGLLAVAVYQIRERPAAGTGGGGPARPR